MKTILFAPETFNLAETSRCLELAKRLASDYRCLFSGYSERFSGLITEAGFEFYHLEPQMSEADCQKMLDFDQFKSLKRPLSHQQIVTRIEQEIALIKAQRVSLVVIGSTITTFISARHCQVPLVYVKPYALSLADCLARSKGSGVLEKIGLSAWLKSPLIPFRLNTIAKTYGVSPFKRTYELMEADLNLITTLRELGGFQKLPSNYAYIGPIYFRKEGEMPEAIQAKTESRRRGWPLVYFAMGSSANRSLVMKLLTCLNELDIVVIAPVKMYLSEQERAIFEHSTISLTDWLPADSVNQLADVALIHGGEGTVQTACASGKPFLGMGLQLEQHRNIQSCVTYGNALAFKKTQINANHLNNCLTRLLSEPTFAKQALKMQELMVRTDGVANGRRIIKSLLD